jgi:dTDP-4-dehydrorhamnose 3,5-epimerase
MVRPAASLPIVQAVPQSLEGVWTFEPVLRGDDRGVFLESFKESVFAEALGHEFSLRQMNISVSRAGTVRGVHFAQVPPGQAKYVQCLAGRVLDVIVDIRVGSPTFGQHLAYELDDVSRHALYVSEGLGHAFCALSESATVGYLCSEPYAPTREFGVHPLDPDLELPWPDRQQALLSVKDAAAPTLREAEAQGLLPTYEQCQAFITGLRGGNPSRP